MLNFSVFEIQSEFLRVFERGFNVGSIERPVVDGTGGQRRWVAFPSFDGQMAVTQECATVFTVMETPGHTPGGITYFKGNEMYCGDTLFQGSMGRTDLYGGDDTAMFASLKRLGQLEGYYKVFPGHGSATNLDDEKVANPFLRRAIKM